MSRPFIHNKKTTNEINYDSKYLNTNTPDKMNYDLNVGGNKIFNVIDSDDIVTKTTIDNNLESRRQVVDTALSFKVDRTLFDTELAKKVNQDVYETAINLLSNDVRNRVVMTRYTRELTIIDGAIEKKVDQTVFDTELAKKVNQDVYEPGFNLLLNTKLDKSEYNSNQAIVNNKIDRSAYLAAEDVQNRKITNIENSVKTLEDIQTTRVTRADLLFSINNLNKIKDGRLDENVIVEGNFKKIVLYESRNNEVKSYNKVLFQRNDGAWFDSASFMHNNFKDSIFEIYEIREIENLISISKLICKYVGTFPAQWTKRYKVFYSI